MRARDARQAPQKPEAPERGQTSTAPGHVHGESTALRSGLPLPALAGAQQLPPAPLSAAGSRSGPAVQPLAFKFSAFPPPPAGKGQILGRRPRPQPRPAALVPSLGAAHPPCAFLCARSRTGHRPAHKYRHLHADTRAQTQTHVCKYATRDTQNPAQAHRDARAQRNECPATNKEKKSKQKRLYPGNAPGFMEAA